MENVLNNTGNFVSTGITKFFGYVDEIFDRTDSPLITKIILGIVGLSVASSIFKVKLKIGK